MIERDAGAINAAEYKQLQDYIYDKLGIDVDDTKKETVTTKINKLMRKHEMSSPREYIKYILGTPGPDFIQEFFNEITTNTTSFFREVKHFDYIKNNISAIINDVPRIKRDGEIRVWSAPCSSGEEPVTLAITLKECLPPGINIKILATDISEKILRKAINGVYTENECKGLSKNQTLSYFTKLPDGFYQVGESIKKCVTYRLFNVMDDFKFKKSFDIIFCRNLMIYMDRDIQQKLVNKFYDVLVPNGLFMIGHSESMLNKKHDFKYVQTALYRK